MVLVIVTILFTLVDALLTVSGAAEWFALMNSVRFGEQSRNA